MSCCLRSLLSGLEHVRTTDGFSRTHGYNECIVELSSALYGGILSAPKAVISAFGNVQYHREISIPLGGTLSVLQKGLITLEGKMDDRPPDVLL